MKTEDCPACGAARGATCNRGVCGMWRTVEATFSTENGIVRCTADIPPNVHRGRVEATMQQQLTHEVGR